MVLRTLLFALAAYGIAIVIAVCVALIVKGIGLVVSRGEKGAEAENAKQET